MSKIDDSSKIDICLLESSVKNNILEQFYHLNLVCRWGGVCYMSNKGYCIRAVYLMRITLRDVSYNARWFWTTIRYGPMTTAYLCWTTGNGF